MEISEMKEKAGKIRSDIVRMLGEAGSGHPGGSLSVTDLLVMLYFKHLKHDPGKPDWEDRDRVVLSKGHVCPGLYATLAEAGYFPVEELMTLRKLGSRLQGHPAKDKNLPGIEVSTGSLGQGLSIGVGMAFGMRLDKKSNRIYVIMGDGEQNEGSVWEAAMAAAHHKLANLTAIIDCNKLQIDGRTEDVMDILDIGEKYRAFGWDTIEIDGHNYEEIDKAFTKARSAENKPAAIIAHTVKGKGVSFMENVASWHGKAPKPDQVEKALEDISKMSL